MKKAVRILHVVVVLVITAFTIFAYSLFERLYLKYSDARLNPLGDQTFGKDIAGSYDFILIGDSLIENLQIENGTVLNLGIGGQTSSQVRYRIELLNKKIDSNIAIICVGGNDLKSIRFGKVDIEYLVNKVISNLEVIIDYTKDKSKNVFILTIPQIYSIPFYLRPLKYTKDIVNAINRTNEKIIELANRNGVDVINTGLIFEKEDKAKILASDKVHLSSYANTLILQQIIKGYEERANIRMQ